MSTLPSPNIFRFIGYRITKLDIDESSLGDASEPMAAEITTAFSTPTTGSTKNGKTTLEMSLQLDVAVKRAEGSAPQPSAVSIRLVAGLSVDGEFNEAAQRRLEHDKTHYARSLYWLLRDHLMSAARSTKFRALPLPWDVWELGWPPNGEPTSDAPRNKGAPKKPAAKRTARAKK